ncbi:cytochrome c oxidase subunit II [Roseisolibacter sp. H3M3-2]|uniref:cytochrome c oxidase subunit II n=1 Tax=Roseisolibacter sp. H3M3-2 TaxID=3031323 RepID=UPI0023DCE713|nr:cytochrome c oxidase subunit II [Roseisolibacter sp. H3M3-2]MDF1504879.1 cytochrome c oxidase subunit II [Roseisolibacter sp. H3M3-2]
MSALPLAALRQAVAPQSALRAGGPEAEQIGLLWNVLLVVGTAVTVGVLAFLAYALFRRRGDADETQGDRRMRAGVRWMVAGGVVLPIVVLMPILVLTMRTLGAVTLPSRTVASADEPPAPGEFVVEVTGRQYWWEVRYRARRPDLEFETANELRVPVGRRVVVRLRSRDVIHSFWVPGLQGKMDLVPGRTNALVFTAARPGRWRGQCAEFCGAQHAKMAFTVVAEPAAEWQAWAARQRADARPPADPATRAAQGAFLNSGCVLCHAVRGTPARGDAGPDLTHLASRLTLAAGTLPNTRGHLTGWVADPQSIKPGSLMPSVPLEPRTLHAIVRYLETLD